MMYFRLAATAAIVLTAVVAGAAAPATATLSTYVDVARASGSYAILTGEDTAVIERWNRTDDELDVSMDVVGQARLEFKAGLSADASISTMSMRVFAPGEQEPLGEASATFVGDSVIAIQSSETGMDTVQRGTRSGAVAYLSPSVALTEQIIRRAQALGGESVEVPVFVVGSGGQTLDATVSFTGDSVSVRLADSEMRLGMAPDGGISGGSIPGEPSVRIVRVDG